MWGRLAGSWATIIFDSTVARRGLPGVKGETVGDVRGARSGPAERTDVRVSLPAGIRCLPLVPGSMATGSGDGEEVPWPGTAWSDGGAAATDLNEPTDPARDSALEGTVSAASS